MPSIERHGLSFLSPIGPLTLLEESNALVELRFSDEGLHEETPLLLQAQAELLAYFAGELLAFSVPLQPHGTAFRHLVWKALQEIPYAQTCSYRDIAVRIKSPKAMRAVGTACGANPLPVFIPCHRVITSQGGLGGYSGGLPIKQALLRLEQGSTAQKDDGAHKDSLQTP